LNFDVLKIFKHIFFYYLFHVTLSQSSLLFFVKLIHVFGLRSLSCTLLVSKVKGFSPYFCCVAIVIYFLTLVRNKGGYSFRVKFVIQIRDVLRKIVFLLVQVVHRRGVIYWVAPKACIWFEVDVLGSKNFSRMAFLGQDWRWLVESTFREGVLRIRKGRLDESFSDQWFHLCRC
jgi:hypothetical protein